MQTNTYKELLLGCGASRDKRVVLPGTPREWQNLVTLDFNSNHKPDIVFDLNFCKFGIPDTHGDRCADSVYDEIHAYEVLEHLGQQGDFLAFFEHFYEFWRIVKPNGYLVGTSPLWNSPWSWGDPGHTRIISPECFVFLDQDEYAAQIGKTSMSDYRSVWKGNFKRRHIERAPDGQSFVFILQAIK